MADIVKVKKEYQELLQEISDPGLISNWGKFEELKKRKADLEKIIEKEKEIKEIQTKIEESKSLLSANEGRELVALAEQELISLSERKAVLEKELETLLKIESKKTFHALSGSQIISGGNAVIVEIRAGAGGEEAGLFAADLFKMYSKYGQTQGWKQKVLDSRPSELGGFKEIIFEFKNGDVFSKMKYEGGVHRVQRIPATEKSGRVHTSTASVAVLPKPKKAQIKIGPQEIVINFYRSSGPGGQYVNKRETAVRITHLATGFVVTSQTERNQLQNRENAMSILEARLLEKNQREEEGKLGSKRKTQIGGAKRAEKIRTYNFPQNRITDHRITKSWHNLDKIIAGDLGPIVIALEKNNPVK